MSAKIILALALVALVAVQANSNPYAAKEGQLEQESVQAQPQGQLSTSSQQLTSTPSAQHSTETATTVAQTEAVPAQQQQQYYGAPAQTGQQVASVSTPAQTTLEVTPAVPAPSAFYPSKGQAFYQQQAPVFSSTGGQAHYYQQESVPFKGTVSQAPAAGQISYVAPAKGQAYYQQPAQVYSSKGGQAFHQQLESAAPFKGVQAHYTKSQWVAPARQEAVVAQQPLPAVSAPVKTQATAFDYQSAPSKAYYHRQPRLPLRAPFRGFQIPRQQYAAKTVAGQSPLKA